MSAATLSQVTRLGAVVLAKRREGQAPLDGPQEALYAHPLHPLVAIAQPECGVAPTAGPIPPPPPHVPLMAPFAMALVSVMPVCILDGGVSCCHWTGILCIVMGPAPALLPCWLQSFPRLLLFSHVILVSDISLPGCHRIWHLSRPRLPVIMLC